MMERRYSDFLTFKRLLFQVRDGIIAEETYLFFLAGYFGIVPTEEDISVPTFKGKVKEE